MAPKNINVRVTTVDAELEFAIQHNTTGKQIFDQVAKTIGVREIWWFGMQYVDSKGFPTWLKLNKKVLSQDVKKETPMQFQFKVKFYPEDVDEELILEATRKLFFLQIKSSVLNDEIYCPPETSVLLASYACQAKYDHMDPERHVQGFLSNDKVLPERVYKQHEMTKEVWESKIIEWWAEHNEMPREDAMLEYMKIAQDLEMYGVNYFEIKNKKGTVLWLGVDALGLNIYEKDDRLTPRIGFPWSEIRNISFNDKKFVIKPIDKKAPDFIFFTSRLRINKRILALCMGNHELYMRRRRQDSIEVQQMKATAKQDKLTKNSDRKKLKEAEDRVKQLERAQQELAYKSQRTEEELDAERRAKVELDNKKQRAEEELEAEKRAKWELQMKQQEIDEKYRLMEITAQEEKERAAQLEKAKERAEEESKYVKLSAEKTEEQRRAEQEKRRQLEREKENLQRMKEREVEELRRSHQEEATLWRHNQMPREAEQIQEVSNSADLESIPDVLNSSDPAKRNRSEEERETTIASSRVDLAAKLKLLSADLSEVKKPDELTNFDHQHEVNVKQGRSKYKTLQQIRLGNTKQRVDQFENL